MAGELVYAGNPATQAGKSVTATVYTMAGSVVAPGISCAETGSTAIYVGNMPAAAAGRYIVEFFSSGLLLSQPALIEWDGSAEIRQTGDAYSVGVAIKSKTDTLPATPASSADCLTAVGVRTAVGLASANLDAQISTLTGYVDTEVAAIKAKTDLIPPSPAATGDIPTASSTAAAVRTELAVELARIDMNISDVVAGTVDPAPIAAAILAATDLDTYPPHTLARVIHKLDIGAPDAPILPVPSPPGAGQCKAYLFTESVIGVKRAGLQITARLSAAPATAGGYVLEAAAVTATTNADGYAEFNLPATAEITPAGTYWIFDSSELGLADAAAHLGAGLFDLKRLCV